MFKAEHLRRATRRSGWVRLGLCLGLCLGLGLGLRLGCWPVPASLSAAIAGVEARLASQDHTFVNATCALCTFAAGSLSNIINPLGPPFTPTLVGQFPRSPIHVHIHDAGFALPWAHWSWHHNWCITAAGRQLHPFRLSCPSTPNPIGPTHKPNQTTKRDKLRADGTPAPPHAPHRSRPDRPES